MDAHLSNTSDLSYLDEPPIVIAGTSDAAMARAASTVRTSEYRVGPQIRLDREPEQLSWQARASALWVEIDQDPGSVLDDFLDRVAQHVRDQRCPAVVCTSKASLDIVVARADQTAIEIIVDADEAERAAALATATTLLRHPTGVHDVAADRNADRLRQLSEEVSRIASTLARLSSGPATLPQVPTAAVNGEIPPISGEMVRKVIRARRLRANYFSEELFADPAWDMMLDLLQAEIAQLRVPVSSLCIAASVPATTALRWLKTLVAQRLFLRRADPHDGRRVFVELAPATSEALRRYFGEVGQTAVV